MFDSNAPTHRRGFLARLSAAAAGLGLLSVTSDASAADVSSEPSPDESWLRALTGKHKTAFDVDAHKNGNALAQAKSFLDAWKAEYQLEPPTVNLVMAVRGTGIPIVLNDALWARYRIGEQYGIVDPVTKEPAVRNPFIAANVQPRGLVTREQTVEALQARRVTFLVCRNTIAGATKRLVAAGFGTTEQVRGSIDGGIVPGVIVVPAMVIAFTQMQEHGVAYVYAG